MSNLQHPWQEDIFPPLTSEEIENHFNILREAGISGDRLSAHLMRQGWSIAMEEVRRQKPYSEIIIEGNEARKTCGQCGQLCVAYKEKFRKQWVICLDALNAFGAMTYKQLADVLVSHYGYKDKAANSTARSFCMARHWLVIEKAGKSIGRCPVYRITSRGCEVLANKQSIPVFMWLPARGIEMDLSVLPQPTWTFAASVLPDDPNEINNANLHVEEAAPALSLF